MAHDRIQSINNQIIYAMKDAAVATLPGWKISYKTPNSRNTKSRRAMPASCGSAISERSNGQRDQRRKFSPHPEGN